MGMFRHAVRKHSPNPSSNLEAASVTGAHGTANNNDTKVGALIPVVQDRRLGKLLHTIKSHPSRKIHDLALECNLSGSRLQHLFKQHTGLRLGQLLTEQRMQQATDFLVHTNMSIKEIASTIGYEHTSSFTRAFERRFRQAPSCYRQAQSPYKMPPRANDVSDADP
jgi:transcriptional regulator GlxA family with amidase domain